MTLATDAIHAALGELAKLAWWPSSDHAMKAAQRTVDAALKRVDLGALADEHELQEHVTVMGAWHCKCGHALGPLRHLKYGLSREQAVAQYHRHRDAAIRDAIVGPPL